MYSLLDFSFSSRSLSRWYTLLFLFSKVENIFYDFSFFSQNWGQEIQISLSPLEIGEIVLKFPFLLSIGLFCLSSMPATGTFERFITKSAWQYSTGLFKGNISRDIFWKSACVHLKCLGTRFPSSPLYWYLSPTTSSAASHPPLPI